MSRVPLVLSVVLTVSPLAVAKAQTTPAPELGVPTPSVPLRLRVTADEPGRTLLVRREGRPARVPYRATDAFTYERLCTAPCDLTLPPGDYRFAVASEEGGRRGIWRPISIGRDGALSLHFQSRRRQRIVRWTSSLTLASIGLPLVIASLTSPSDRYEGEVDIGKVSSGSILLAASVCTGLVASFTFDRARVEYAPDD